MENFRPIDLVKAAKCLYDRAGFPSQKPGPYGELVGWADPTQDEMYEIITALSKSNYSWVILLLLGKASALKISRELCIPKEQVEKDFGRVVEAVVLRFTTEGSTHWDRILNAEVDQRVMENQSLDLIHSAVSLQEKTPITPSLGLAVTILFNQYETGTKEQIETLLLKIAEMPRKALISYLCNGITIEGLAQQFGKASSTANGWVDLIKRGIELHLNGARPGAFEKFLRQKRIHIEQEVEEGVEI